MSYVADTRVCFNEHPKKPLNPRKILDDSFFPTSCLSYSFNINAGLLEKNSVEFNLLLNSSPDLSFMEHVRALTRARVFITEAKN